MSGYRFDSKRSNNNKPHTDPSAYEGVRNPYAARVNNAFQDFAKITILARSKGLLVKRKNYKHNVLLPDGSMVEMKSLMELISFVSNYQSPQRQEESIMVEGGE